jgi:hypothetical protein
MSISLSNPECGVNEVGMKAGREIFGAHYRRYQRTEKKEKGDDRTKPGDRAAPVMRHFKMQPKSLE